mgnify:CR=1 FL=1
MLSCCGVPPLAISLLPRYPHHSFPLGLVGGQCLQEASELSDAKAVVAVGSGAHGYLLLLLLCVCCGMVDMEAPPLGGELAQKFWCMWAHGQVLIRCAGGGSGALPPSSVRKGSRPHVLYCRVLWGQGRGGGGAGPPGGVFFMAFCKSTKRIKNERD